MPDTKDAPAHHHFETTVTTAPSGVHDSNPFTTAWSGIKKLFKLNIHALIGMALFNLLLCMVLCVTFVAAVFTLLAFGLRHNLVVGTYTPPELLGFLSSFSDASIYASWVISLVIFVAVVALLQALQLQLAVASAKRQQVNFGRLLKRGVSLILPLLGYFGLMVLAVAAGGLVLVIFAKLLGFVALVLAFVIVVAAIYAAFRLLFAPYVIIDEGLSPLAALKRSWELTNNHTIETVAAAAVASLITIPNLILSALTQASEASPGLSGTLLVLNAVLAVVLVIMATMAVAERFVQLQAIANKQLTAAPLHPFNYLAIVLMFLVGPLVNAVSPPDARRNNAPGFNDFNNHNS